MESVHDVCGIQCAHWLVQMHVTAAAWLRNARCCQNQRLAQRCRSCILQCECCWPWCAWVMLPLCRRPGCENGQESGCVCKVSDEADVCKAARLARQAVDGGSACAAANQPGGVDEPLEPHVRGLDAMAVTFKCVPNCPAGSSACLSSS